MVDTGQWCEEQGYLKLSVQLAFKFHVRGPWELMLTLGFGRC